MENELLNRLNEVEKKLVYLKTFCIFLVTSFVLCLFLFGFTKNTSFDVIRAKGIVIEDSAGKDRILIGAPIPYSKNRVRTDTALVRKHWGKSYEDQENQYMKWYKGYHHSAEGIVIMNENGFDRVQIGDKLSDPNIGKRQFEIAGIVWNDKQGWELGGAGTNTASDGKTRSIMGVDSPDGEAVHIVAMEDGTRGVIIGGENGRLMIGMSPKNGKWFKNKETFTGVKYFNNQGKVVWEQKIDTLTKK